MFLPFCGKALRPIGITPFQTITTRLYESLLGSCDLSIGVVNNGVHIAWERHCNTQKYF